MKNRIFKLPMVLMFIMLSCSLSAQMMRSEDDIVQYLDNATNLDLIEGIYFDRYESGGQYWRAIVYNKNTGVFDYYDIDSKSRLLKPFLGKYEMHIVRTSKFAYVYYAYITIEGKKYESGTHTFDTEHLYAHWNCGKCDNRFELSFHFTLNLKNKVYPQ